MPSAPDHAEVAHHSAEAAVPHEGGEDQDGRGGEDPAPADSVGGGDERVGRDGQPRPFGLGLGLGVGAAEQHQSALDTFSGLVQSAGICLSSEKDLDILLALGVYLVQNAAMKPF